MANINFNDVYEHKSVEYSWSYCIWTQLRSFNFENDKYELMISLFNATDNDVY